MQDEDLVAIPPTAVRDYAKSRGWLHVDVSKRRYWLFRHPTVELRQLIVPMDSDDDYADALSEVILRLAEFEGSTPETVLENLLLAHSDVVRFRVAGKDIAGGMLPVVDATGLIEGARRALLASACSVINRVRHHLRMSLTEAEELLRVCKLGQTEPGSYVVKIICPLDEMGESPGVSPFARATTALLASACAKLVDNIEQDTVDAMLAREDDNPEISSNLCNALLQMHSASEKNSLTLHFAWAGMPELEMPKVSPSTTFKPEYFRVIEAIERRLGPKQEEQRKMQFVGTVETLNGDVGEDGHRSGEVVFALLLRDEELVKARGILNADDYEKAITAHEKGEGYVAFDGIIKRGPRIGQVEQIENFREL